MRDAGLLLAPAVYVALVRWPTEVSNMMRKLAIGVGLILGLAVLGYVALVIHTILFDDSGTA